MRRFFISPDQIIKKEPLLTGADAHHLRSVLRLKVGDVIIVFDGQGQEYQARIAAIGPETVTLTVLFPLTVHSDSPLELVLAQGYLKDKKMDLLARPLTEIGVTRWIPFRAGRSISVPDSMRLQARHQRWQKLAQEAVKQCGRSRPMAIEPALSLETVLALAQGYDLKLIFYEKAQSLSLARHQHHCPAKALILVGPEGGFEPGEVAQAEAMGFCVVGMGPRILRAQTAALTACALVQFCFGDWG
jgi:16S rRNA (uracil1498-N3)-methyltransferase